MCVCVGEREWGPCSGCLISQPCCRFKLFIPSRSLSFSLSPPLSLFLSLSSPLSLSLSSSLSLPRPLSCPLSLSPFFSFSLPSSPLSSARRGGERRDGSSIYYH